ncbi:NAD(P)/FAD-dependent oxidoreductase [Rhodospirillaceae bacterium SYSU D60014]|uniref:NAD(P)/FAD-dependent oxidoreductase n=1 Tax=Virgifigura deserti TaxID=2268457 RepID=UPI000E66AED7
MDEFEFIVIGAGMAGASVACELSEHATVLLLEQESQPGYHSTGRSAALFAETYGNRTIRALTSGSRAFYLDPPRGFTEHPLLTPRGALFIARPDQTESLDRLLEEVAGLRSNIHRLDGRQATNMVPTLKSDYVADAVVDPDAMDIEVHGLLHGYLRGFRARGGKLVADGGVQALERDAQGWSVRTRTGGAYRGQVVVNAAGAWADEVAGLAGAQPVGLTPKRRTAILFAAPTDVDSKPWPLVIDADEQFYFKPDAGKLLASPADETPVPPCDIQPEELDIAILVDRLQQATDLTIPRIEHSWAGLRTFATDKTPVVGFDSELSGFFWLAGQGGYGIQTAPAMARLAAALARHRPVPSDLADLGVTTESLAPGRFAAVA